jgi:hypothetical protein
MPLLPDEYHPWTACELFKVHGNSLMVRANLYAVLEDGRRSEAP